MTGVELVHAMAEILVSGIVSIGEGIATGVNGIVTALFIGAEGITTFGVIILAFGAVALGFSLTRLVYRLITSLGRRNG